MIHVVTALIIRDRRILLQQRLPKRDFPMAWECPGGKVEPGDASPIFALHRELDEELGHSVRVIDPEPVCSFVFREGEYGLKESATVTFYRVRPSEQDGLWFPKNVDAAGLGWFRVEDVDGMDMIPGNDRLWGFLNQLNDTHPLFDQIWEP